MTFKEKLEKRWSENKFVCIGLDSDYSKIPELFKNGSVDDAIFEFNKSIIEATNDMVCAYKPQISYYEEQGIEGIKALEKTIKYLKENYPDIPVILDAKRGDIGSTNLGYVKAYFDKLDVDALTVHPYLGKEALQPFLDYKDKGIIVLVKTSNPGSGEFQDLEVDGEPLYMKVAKQITNEWNTNGNCAVVVGATYPEELKKIRGIVGDIPILIPGIGAQGGDVKETIKAGVDSRGWGMIISTSRAVIFADNPKEACKKLADEIQSYVANGQ